MELWEYVEVLVRWGWVILLVTALCAAAAFGFVQLQTPRYSSTVEVSVTPSRLEAELSQAAVNLLRNYVSSIQSEGMARKVIDRMGLNNIDAAALRRKIAAEADEAEFKVKIEVTDTDPILAQHIAQAVAQILVEDVQAFALRQDPLDRLTASMLNGGAQAAGQSWPRKKLMAFLGVGGGLTLGLLIALALEWARVEFVQTPQQAEQWLELPVLGSIPASSEPSRPRWKRAAEPRLPKRDKS